MCSCSNFLNCSLVLAFPPSFHPWLLSQFLVLGEMVRVESRTHEILKSFLGSPHHQHMLLSSLLCFVFFYFSCFLCYYSSHSSSFNTHSHSHHSFIDSLFHSVGYLKINNNYKTIIDLVFVYTISIWSIHQCHPLTSIYNTYLHSCLLISAANYFAFMKEIQWLKKMCDKFRIKENSNITKRGINNC